TRSSLFPYTTLFRSGQFLDKKTINAYLGPKYTKSEIEKMDKDEKEEKNANENLGLNPSRHGEKDEEKIAENSPAYLSNILEQDLDRKSTRLNSSHDS